MNFYLKQKVFSWRDKFEVYDVSGRPLYYAEGEIFSLGKHLRLYDLSGRAAAAICLLYTSFHAEKRIDKISFYPFV